ncbi:MAG: hypothetical protein ACR9NN_20130 [Nostochopsis sp.]
MNIKQIIVGVALVLPLAVTSLPTQASAEEVIVKPPVHHPSTRKVPVTPPKKVVRPRASQRVWIPARWENTRHGRRRIPGHYVYR